MDDRSWIFWRGTLEPMPLGMHCKPWCKDKLPSRCFPKYKNRLKLPNSLDSRGWVFVKEGVDDFRKGCPPCKGLITQRRKENFLPIIFQKAPPPAPKKSWKKPPMGAALCTKLSQAQLARKAFVADIEARLAPHPLGCYPNLEKYIPVELLLKVLEVLDPEKKLEDTWAYCQGEKKKTKEPTKLPKLRPAKVCLELSKKTPRIEPDDSLSEEAEQNENDMPVEPTPPTRVRRGVRDFCKWIATFGIMDIDDEFIIKQFSIGYDYTPTHNVVRIKKIKDVSTELKYSEDLKRVDEIKLNLEENDWEEKFQKLQLSCKPKHVKMRYGAWYLHPKFWKKRRDDEPLLDPNYLPETDEFGFRRKDKEEWDILEDLYGTIAFKDFILNKGYRMPGFIERFFIRKKWTYDHVKTPTVLSTKATSSTDESEADD